MIARYVPGLAESVASTFALADASKLGSLFDEVGFDTVRHAFVLPSFDAYYGPFERGGCSTGQALVGLSEEIRRAVREEARRDLRDTGGPVKPEAEYRNCQRPTLKEREHRLPRPGERLVPARLPARSSQEGGEQPPNEINRIKAASFPAIGSWRSFRPEKFSVRLHSAAKPDNIQATAHGDIRK